MVTTSVTDDNIKRHCEDETLLKLSQSGLVQRLMTFRSRPYGRGWGANSAPRFCRPLGPSVKAGSGLRTDHGVPLLTVPPAISR
jgi:hypothetical protein